MALASHIKAERARYRERFPGWRSINLPFGRCFRFLAWQDCDGENRDSSNCICVRLGFPLLDHPRAFRTPDGEKVMTYAPYHIYEDEVQELREHCKDIGLEVTIEDYSPYNPGHAWLIIINRARP